jgi:hypothetical protein
MSLDETSHVQVNAPMLLFYRPHFTSFHPK